MSVLTRVQFILLQSGAYASKAVATGRVSLKVG
jgi:hypothetical protein